LEKFKQTDLREDFKNHKKSVAITRRELRRIKQDKFRDFCEGLRKDSDPLFGRQSKDFNSDTIKLRQLTNILRTKWMARIFEQMNLE